MEEVANGEKVLVSKLYLSKNGLKSIVEEQGNIIKADGNITQVGVKVVSSGSIDLKGKNVEINTLETKSYNKHEKVKKASQVLLVQKEYQYPKIWIWLKFLIINTLKEKDMLVQM